MKLRRISAVAAAVGVGLAIWTAFTAAHTSRERIAMINKSTPVLHVKSVEPSLKFWTERFGFKKTIDVPEGDHLGFIALEKGTVEVMYQTYSGMKADPANPLAQAVERAQSFLFMAVSDLNAVPEPLKGAHIVLPHQCTFHG